MYLISSLLAILVFFFNFRIYLQDVQKSWSFFAYPLRIFIIIVSLRFLDCSIKAPNCYIPLSLNKSASFFIFEKKERDEKKSSQNFLTFDSWILLELLCLSKVFIYKSCHEPFLLVQCATYTFQPSQSCNFKKIKVYETKLFINNIIFASFLNLN